MKLHSHTPRPCAARGVAILCAAVFVASAHTAHAGINAWTSHGPAGGQQVFAIALDPVTPGTLYVATQFCGGDCGGVFFKIFKSMDAGATWDPVSALLGGTDNVHALVVHPSMPSRLYAGTNDTGVFDIEQVTGVVGTGTAASCTDAALNAALAGGGLVTFNCGGPATIDISTGTGTKTIAADTTIDGGGLITISGGNSFGVFFVFNHNGPVKFTVENLIIADGSGPLANLGGGIHNGGGAVTVSNSTFSRNSGDLGGGGIYNNGGTLSVTKSTFSANSSNAASEFGFGCGGGVFNERGGTLTVTNSTFTGNSASNGGGICNYDATFATLTVTNSTFTGNSASSGGGIFTSSGTLTVTNSTFVGNRATGGGCISTRGTLTVTNSTLHRQ